MVSVEDNGQGMNAVELESMQQLLDSDSPNTEYSGLLNVHRRLQIKFGESSGLRLSLSELLDLSISFVVANSPCDWHEIASRCEMLRTGLDKFSASDEKIIMIERTIEELKGDTDGSGKENSQINRTLFRKINMLESILDSGHKQEFIESTTDIIRSIQEQKNISAELNIELFYTLLTAVLSSINRCGLEGKIAGAFDFSRLTNKQGMPIWDMVLVNVINMADACLSEKRNLVLNNNNKMLDYIKMYVKNNLDGDLSLTYFSKQLHFNPSYLSRLFRQMTGIRLSDYIIVEKLIKVKELLKTSNKKIAEIATSIGYDNPSHFSYFFKKHTGVNPQEFRDSSSDQ